MLELKRDKHAFVFLLQTVYSDMTTVLNKSDANGNYPDSTLTQLTAQLELPVQGIAIAVSSHY